MLGGGGLRELSYISNNLVDFCRNGVYVFFVISGFSVASSYENSSSYISYLTRRMWRIFPLYYFWIIVCILTGLTSRFWIEKFAIEIDVYNVLMHFLFISFLDYKITNSIIGAEWSIPIEVFWYLIVPFIILAVRDKGAYYIFLSIIFSLIVYILLGRFFSWLPFQDRGLMFQWSPVKYLICYVLGVAAYKFRQIYFCSKSDLVLLFAILICISYLIFPNIIGRLFYDEFIFVNCLTFVLIVCGNSKSYLFSKVFTNPVSLFLGTISYGIYLAHLPLMELLNRTQISLFENLTVRFIIVTFLSILVSTVTFYTIEKSGMSIGKKYSK